MKYVIVGAGWYGCHIASLLVKNNKEILIIDKANDFFTGSSSKNQNRLHLGFHYPRSMETIHECKYGYEQFVKKYNQLISHIPNNNYYISKTLSKINIQEFIKKIDEAGLDYTSLATDRTGPLNLKGLEDHCFNTREMYIDHRKATRHFKDTLSKYLHKCPDKVFSSIYSIKEYLGLDNSDILINCTYNQLNAIEYEKYELYISLIYKIDIDIFAITIMDGPFFSIYPYDIENKLYTVTSVEHGVIYSGESLIDASINHGQFTEIREKIERLLDEYIDHWRTHFIYEGYNLSWKTKAETTTDDRSVRINRDGNVINIYGGKITGIFNAEKYIEKVLLKDS
jgi:hypothetical protein